MAKVTLHRPSIYEHGPVRLIAGENEISDEDMAGLKANPVVAMDIAAGVLSIADDKAAKVRAKAKAEDGE